MPVHEVGSEHDSGLALLMDGRQPQQTLWIRVRDGAQDDGVEDAEDRRVHADAERQRQDHDCREPGTTTECAERVARILQQLIDPQRDSHNRRPPSRSRYSAELEHSLTARVLVTSAGRYCPRFLARCNANRLPGAFPALVRPGTQGEIAHYGARARRDGARSFQS